MKTKQLFITLISSTLLLACSTDDSVLEDESVVLETAQQQERMIEKLEYYDEQDSDGGASSNNSNSVNNNNCIYLPHTIYYPSSAVFYLSDYVYAIIYRAHMMKQRLGTTGCFIYNFPDNRSFKYINGVYSERIEKIYLDAMAPIGVEDDIEL